MVSSLQIGELTIYGIGVLLNGWMLITMHVWSPPLAIREGRQKLNRSLAALLGVCFLYSAFALGTGMSPPAWSKYWAYANSFAVVALFAMNLIVAIERYGAIAALDTRRETLFYKAVLLLASFVFLGNGTLQVLAPSQSGMFPRYESTPFVIWSIGISIYYVLMAVGTGYCYYVCYAHIRNHIEQAVVVERQRAEEEKRRFMYPPSSPRGVKYNPTVLNAVAMKSQSKIDVLIEVNEQMMRNCSLMAAGIIVFYLPYVLYLFLPRLGSADDVVYTSIVLFAALDILWSPVLVLYFSPEIRRACTCNMIKE